MMKQYPKAEGPLLAAVLRAQKLCGDENWQARQDAEQEIIRMCPHPLGSTLVGTGMVSFSGRQFRLKSVEVASGPHHVSRGTYWYWVLRGPLLLKSGKISALNEVTSFETFHVDIPPAEPIPGDAGF